MNRLIVSFLTIQLLLIAACSPAVEQDESSPWRPLAAMEQPRSEMPAVALDGQFYVPGGLSDQGVIHVEAGAERYDPVTNSWEIIAEMPAQRHHLAAAGWDRFLYLFGGFTATDWSGTSDVWRYDPERDEWTTLNDAPQRFGAGAAVTIADAIYLIGGMPDGRSVWQYDPVGDLWRELAPLLEPREHVAAAVLEGEIYVVGGRWSGVGERTTVEIYEPLTNSWRFGPELEVARSGHAVVALNGDLFAIGGEVLGSREALASVERLPAGASSWERGSPLPVGLHGVPALADGDTIYLLGGSRAGAAIENDGIVYSWAPDR